MRADRLVAILLLLQRRGRITTRQVAEELEISQRTARRDLEALGVAGLPVYSQPGRYGGWQLAGDGKTDLSGLTSTEAQALFAVVGPSASATPELRAALRKLVRALPEQFRTSAERASESIVVDRREWGETLPRRQAPDLLEAVRDAVMNSRQLRLGYTSRSGEVTERIVEPLGLAAKGETWYLIGDTAAGMRTFRVDRASSVVRTGLPATAPGGFVLSEAWSLIADRIEDLRSPVVAQIFVEPHVVSKVMYSFGTRVRVGSAPPGARVRMELRGRSVAQLAAQIGGFGHGVIVVEPAELRDELARVGHELVGLYRP